MRKNLLETSPAFLLQSLFVAYLFFYYLLNTTYLKELQYNKKPRKRQPRQNICEICRSHSLVLWFVNTCAAMPTQSENNILYSEFRLFRRFPRLFKSLIILGLTHLEQQIVKPMLLIINLQAFTVGWLPMMYLQNFINLTNVFLKYFPRFTPSILYYFSFTTSKNKKKRLFLPKKNSTNLILKATQSQIPQQ